MTYTVSGVRKWQPSLLSDAATSLETSNIDFETKLNTARSVALSQSQSSHGHTAEAAWQKAEKDHRLGIRLADATDKVIEVLRSGATRLQSVRDNAISHVDASVLSKFEVSDDWKVGACVIAGPYTADELEKQQKDRKAFQEAIDAALQQLADEDDAVAFALDGANDEVDATKGDVTAGRDYAPPSLVGLTPEQAKTVLDDPRFQEWVKNHPDAAKPLLDTAFDAGLVPEETYGEFLQDYWLRESLEGAEIDLSNWDLSKGAEYNADTITKVYEYYGPDTGRAWDQIEAGVTQDDPALIAAGNTQLLHREQFDIIADDYEEMRSRPVTGEAMTWMLTTVGTPSIPGASAYSELYPADFELDNSRYIPGSMTVQTPFPDGNIADENQRWRLITEDTLPAYQRLLADDPDEARRIVGSDFDTRVDEQRLDNQMDGILSRLLTDWKFDPHW